jgi:hypothetical protein
VTSTLGSEITLILPNMKQMIPTYFKIFYLIIRLPYTQDKSLNFHGKSLVNLCISSRLRILNGRYLGDSLGYHTCFPPNGCSTVDYGIVSKCLLSSVKYFCTLDLSYLSDHVQNIFYIEMQYKSFFQTENRYSLEKVYNPNPNPNL